MSRKPSGPRLKAEAYTQWETGVAAPSSACGPATMAALLEYWHSHKGRVFVPGFRHFGSKAAHINYIYTHHGGTPWGMSVRSLVRGLRAYIRQAAPPGEDRNRRVKVSVFNDIGRYRAEIDAARPVALKFDKWFSFRWRGSYVYDYHWVLGIGYEDQADGSCTLVVHDNGVRHPGGAYTPGRERQISYTANTSILTMVSLDLPGIQEVP
ncbi:C39 family peptidase [Paenibacillus tritici]|uniref:C39 family peptidase n=1 Tax=Paenibacillus tritici TaxID=1873425 RepID=A0ABX2DQU3_9BACL|nr:C39 family peptidase [Paenibacillus tritici]NQX46790.1 C39 family peptidase [Paenibacillus tritici]